MTRLAWCFALWLIAVARAEAAVTALRAIVLTVSDLDRSERFYRDTLGFTALGRRHVADPALDRLLGAPDRAVETLTLRLGNEKLECVRFARPGRPYPAKSRSNDRWFQHFAIVVSDMDRAYARVRASGAMPITQGPPPTLPASDGGVRAYKFRDPDGHPLELLWFPPGQGRAMWHGRPGLFLGIDHSAIAIASTQASLAFYRDRLGLRVAYTANNQGPAQSELDGLSRAVVRITGLRTTAPDSAGIEFLDYRSPANSEPILALHAGDIAGTYLVLEVDDLQAILAGWQESRPVLLLPGLCAATVLDPDRHRLLLEQAIPTRRAIRAPDWPRSSAAGIDPCAASFPSR